MDNISGLVVTAIVAISGILEFKTADIPKPLKLRTNSQGQK